MNARELYKEAENIFLNAKRQITIQRFDNKDYKTKIVFFLETAKGRLVKAEKENPNEELRQKIQNLKYLIDKELKRQKKGGSREKKAIQKESGF